MIKDIIAVFVSFLVKDWKRVVILVLSLLLYGIIILCYGLVYVL